MSNNGIPLFFYLKKQVRLCNPTCLIIFNSKLFLSIKNPSTIIFFDKGVS